MVADPVSLDISNRIGPNGVHYSSQSSSSSNILAATHRFTRLDHRGNVLL